MEPITNIHSKIKTKYHFTFKTIHFIIITTTFNFKIIIITIKAKYFIINFLNLILLPTLIINLIN